jgi:hypothetical protein
MKYIIGSLAIGACLVLPSAEAVFAAQPAHADCGAVGVSPGNSANSNGSPFAADTGAFEKNYSGSGSNPTNPAGTNFNQHANTTGSRYDVACVNVAANPKGRLRCHSPGQPLSLLGAPA